MCAPHSTKFPFFPLTHTTACQAANLKVTCMSNSNLQSILFMQEVTTHMTLIQILAGIPRHVAQHSDALLSVDRCVVQVVHMDKPHQDKPPKMPTENYNYHHKLVHEWRTDLKPLNVDQPEGPSFQVPSYVLATTSLQMPALPVYPFVLAVSLCVGCWPVGVM